MGFSLKEIILGSSGALDYVLEHQVFNSLLLLASTAHM
jgi:hypothetical protein